MRNLIPVIGLTLAFGTSAPAQLEPLEPVVNEVCTVLGCEAVVCGACEGDLAECQSDLASCNDGYGDCQSDLRACDADLATCNSGYASYQSQLSSCEASLATGKSFPASGQTTTYPANKLDDPVTGDVAVPDDGTMQAGAELAYVDNGDGTITDLNTGLMWEKKGDDGGLHDKDNVYVWSGNGTQETIWDWLDDVNAEGGSGFAGHSDWRVPNVKELQSIVDYERFGPAVGGAFNDCTTNGCSNTVCSCTQSQGYWSSTSTAFTRWAWALDFFSGSIGGLEKSDQRYVRAVRGGTQ
jgi:hypothetical protein